MSTGKLLDKFRKYMDLDRQRQKEKRDKIRSLLKKLKKKQRMLEEALQKTTDSDKRKHLQRDLNVVQAQRKKGVKLCRAIRCKK